MRTRIEKDFFLVTLSQEETNHLSSRERTLLALEELHRKEEKIPLDFRYDERGKPVFPLSPYYLSVTHTGALHGVAVSLFPIGLDGEHKNEVRPRVAERYFAPEEEGESFAHLWCAKEAVAKLLGEGISALSRICVREKEAFCDEKTYFLRYFSEGDYLLAVAVEQE